MIYFTKLWIVYLKSYHETYKSECVAVCLSIMGELIRPKNHTVQSTQIFASHPHLITVLLQHRDWLRPASALMTFQTFVSPYTPVKMRWIPYFNSPAYSHGTVIQFKNSLDSILLQCGSHASDNDVHLLLHRTVIHTVFPKNSKSFRMRDISAVPVNQISQKFFAPCHLEAVSALSVCRKRRIPRL